MIPREDTIVAIATPPGPGGIGVVRLSGPSSREIADSLFHGSSPLSKAQTHTLHHGWVEAGGEKIDEVVAGLFVSPKSYTGEDVVEFSCHGSPALLKELVEACVAKGARNARPGEFTERAFLNGKIDLVQAEAVADLVSAGSRKARRAAAAQLEGRLSDQLKDVKSTLVSLLAHLEANLDFVEEDIPPLERKNAEKTLGSLIKRVNRLLEGAVRGRLVKNGIRIALVGRPNVGKSSLFNALLGNNRAIVTDTPGTTRDTLEEQIEWRGFQLVLTDTAGLRNTADKIEAEGTTRSRKAAEAADAVCVVLDASEPMTEEDQEIINSLKNFQFIPVLNKVDLGRRLETTHLGIQSLASIEISAKTGAGLETLKDALVAEFEKAAGLETENILITNQRQAEELNKIQSDLNHAFASFEKGRREEEIAVELRAALSRLGNLLGESIQEDVLNAIFRQFCIGK